MKDIEGNEHIDYFDQDTILDYIDGRLSAEDTALFEQQMQQDETLQLTVEGIKGFYAQEQKDRPYLENLMTQSEESLRGALASAETKTVALAARRRNVIGISIAACVALLMVFSIPLLLDNSTQEKTNEAVSATTTDDAGDSKTQLLKKADGGNVVANSDENAAETGRKDMNMKGNTKLLTDNVIALSKEKTEKTKPSPERIKTEGNVLEEEDKGVASPPPPVIGLTPEKAKVSAKDEQPLSIKKAAEARRRESFEVVTTTRSAKPKSKAAGKMAKKRKRNQNAYLKGRSMTTKGDFSDQKSTHKYRAPGKLHLWVFADESNLNYYTLMKVGRDVATKTGMQLASQKSSTQTFVSQQWGNWLSAQQVNNNDVVWVYYLGKSNTQLNAAINRLNNALTYNNAALKLIMVDNGSQRPSYSNYANLNNTNKNAGQTPVVVQSQSIGTPEDNAYQKLFLGTSGNITVLSNKLGNTAYQGLFTQNLMQNLQRVSNDQSKRIDWNSVLKQTDRQIRKQSRAFGKTQKMEKRKIRVKKSY